MRPIPNNILQPHVCCLIFKLKSGCWERRISYVDTSWIDWSGMFVYLSDDAKQQLTYFLSLSQAAWGGHTSKYLNALCTEIRHLVQAHCHIKTTGSPNYTTLDFGSFAVPISHESTKIFSQSHIYVFFSVFHRSSLETRPCAYSRFLRAYLCFSQSIVKVNVASIVLRLTV